MTAAIIDGAAVARASRARTAGRAAAFRARHGVAPGLATVLVGDDPASEVYVRNKRRAATEAGIADFHRHLDARSAPDDLAGVIADLGADHRVSGILLQLPVPQHLDGPALVDLIPPDKDVDGLTTLSQGLLARGLPGLRPCTPSGVIELLDSADVGLAGAHVVVVGRSELVGKPMAQLLLGRDATVTIAHSRTRNLEAVTREADILVVAAGRPALITARHVKPGAAVIDVGIHRTSHGLAGDVAFDEVSAVAGYLTPVPGGVGPMTIAALLSNTVSAAEIRAAATESTDRRSPHHVL
ncbi:MULTISPECIES: bifunctional methylenetetrahydrofolate dehydrogenase/methenyltetrahydrofolate cyclohydrolase FolD [Streptomyces]|uniref:Bifunctional protein FolD n=1 Tax=Streptomyces dengpaensis TaxID=2049881 RepID=A0ABM6SK44_9ACTN|nr:MULTISPECIES: bifunctional methylenetetrahydrofolate dehydrogenase/methenyltetrahydrofolate cyclohydrolase FolD [Streptomyces]AVH54525.1 bifunctional methylenetetrahydrofolate dehydrogenase/methenyltetrahydrofolate cyclohydrolase FolD [Streptomyces dengpaensis]PIB00251.1 bifunctional 5,10-methylene-tetrahydrofolate dehydrogenase/5,10-methylene-tetrahydrofolate cyclohydrolase [Streptomyces sp. HG99]